MAKLIYSLDGAFLGDFALDKERITIGRRPGNDIQIDNLAISGQHASITIIGKDAFLEDLNSTNGTMVNGKPISKHVLQNGDVIELGKYQLKYVSDTPAAGAAGQDDFEKTMIIRPGAAKAAAPVSTETPAAAAPTPAEPVPAAAAKQEASTVGTGPVAKLQVLNGASQGKELTLTKALTTLGKPGVQVAVITKRPQGYFVTHVEGASYPVVNGQSVGAQAYPLKDHDVLELAGIKMEFYFSPA
ncbi:MAG TPA: FHA domain-containing protein [Methylophilaceae bacterium]|jgi:predicted component of type VI protein secretion system